MHQYSRKGNSFKPTKMCSLKNGLRLLRYAGRPIPKMIKRDGVEKTATNVINQPHKLKGNAKREREKKPET